MGLVNLLVGTALQDVVVVAAEGVASDGVVKVLVARDGEARAGGAREVEGRVAAAMHGDTRGGGWGEGRKGEKTN